jgi:hypothetical protein
MMRSNLVAAFALGIVFGGSAQAVAVAPVKVQAKAVEAMSPVAETGHKWRKRGWRGHHARRYHPSFYGSYGRRHRYRPYLYNPYDYGYGYGYDPYSYGYGYGYGGNCYRPGLSFYWGY